MPGPTEAANTQLALVNGDLELILADARELGNDDDTTVRLEYVDKWTRLRRRENCLRLAFQLTQMLEETIELLLHLVEPLAALLVVAHLAVPRRRCIT